MDAVEYIRGRMRMCRSFGQCEKCPLGGINNSTSLFCYGNSPEEEVSIVEKWSKEHPVMTNAMKFEEVFGGSPIGPWNQHIMCPPTFGRSKNACACDCSECRQWWDEPYKEPEGKE